MVDSNPVWLLSSHEDPHMKKKAGHIYVQREDHVKTPGDGHCKPRRKVYKEKNLQRTTLSTPDLRLVPSKTMKKLIVV